MNLLQSDALARTASRIAACTKCQELTDLRRNCGFRTVPGSGHPNADAMFIGEAPGENEARDGKPFVGRAGKLLDKLLDRSGWKREDVYITNILKCRPPDNRNPSRSEAENCSLFLHWEIQIVRPRVIICLGRHSALNLLKPPREIDEKWWFGRSLSSLRGSERRFREIPVIVTYHPSFLLRSNSTFTDLFLEDMEKAKNVLFRDQSAMPHGNTNGDKKQSGREITKYVNATDIQSVEGSESSVVLGETRGSLENRPRSEIQGRTLDSNIMALLRQASRL